MITVLLGLFYICVPLLLIGTIAIKPQPSKVMWTFTVLSFGSVLAYLWAAARWEIVSIHLRTVMTVLFIIALVFSYKRIRKTKQRPNRFVVIFGLIIHVLLIVFFTGLNWFTFKGYKTPENTIKLVSPFRSGKQIVLNGGGSPFTNGHYHVRPQNYALDIVGLNALGMRSSSISGGRTLEDYVIYGAEVYSPVNGIVRLVQDDFVDLSPPITDVQNPAGNFVLIEFEGMEVLLAHLKKGSINVEVGDKVYTTTVIGKVGNTGNTSEPHLHIHVESTGSPATILDGKAVPFELDGRYLKRGDVLKYEKYNSAKK